MIIAMEFSDELLKRYSEVTKLAVSAYRADAPRDANERDALHALQSGEPVAMWFASHAAVRGYALVRDIFGEPVLVVGVDMPRSVYQQGMRTIRYLGIVGVASGGMFIILFIIILERLMIARLIAMQSEVKAIASSGDISARLPSDRGNDELSQLTGSINTMLGSLEEAQHALTKEKATLDVYLDVVNTMIVVLSPDQTILQINTVGLHKLGYEANDIVGKSWREVCVPEGVRDQVKRVFDALVSGRHQLAEYYEYPISTRDGRELLVAWHNSVIRDEQGKVVATVSSGEDITERRKEDIALRESEERFRMIAQQTGQVMYDYHLASGAIVWAGAISEVIGYTPDEFAFFDIKKWEENIHPQDREEALRLLEEARKQVTKYRAIYRFRRKDGTYFIAEDNGVFLRNDKGEPYRMLGAVADISKRVAAESKLQESERIYRFFIDNSHELIFILDPQGMIRFVNRHVIESLGYKEEELIGKPFSDFLMPESAAKVATSLALRFQSKPQPVMEVGMKSKAGDVLIIEIAEGSVLVHEKGELIGVMVSGYNITQRKRMEDALQRRNKELKHINQLMVGRELKMIQIKQELEDLKKRLASQ